MYGIFELLGPRQEMSQIILLGPLVLFRSLPLTLFTPVPGGTPVPLCARRSGPGRGWAGGREGR